MPEMDIDALEDKVGNKYKLVVAVAKRAEQLRDGSRPLIAIKSHNTITIALTELGGKSVTVDPKDGTVNFRRSTELTDFFAAGEGEGADMAALDELDLDGVVDLGVPELAEQEDAEEDVEELELLDVDDE